MSEAEIQQRIDMIIDPQAKMELRQSLLGHSRKLKAASQAMWEDVCDVIVGKSIV
ncbi:MAG: hypothetical protein PF483_05655 [Halothiobacillus sp.]|jgi:hypothetical protein|nr:hypothetical protein [Halothiobacillus sp.]